METPVLIIDRDIAQFDIAAEMWGDSQPVFSTTTLSDFLNDNQEAEEIIVEVRSDGGSTSEARIIYDMLKNCGKKIITKGYKVNSSAVMIFLAGTERLVAENADFVIHPVWIDAMGLPWQLTGEDLQDFANEIKAEEAKLLDLYIGVIGEENRVDVAELMANSTNLSTTQCLDLGFATGKLEEKGTKTENKRAITFNKKMAALVLKNKNGNKTEMSNLQKVTDTLNSITEKLANLITNNSDEPVTENASIALDGEGSVYFEGDELAEGVAVFSDEAMETPVEDGELTLSDGRTVTVAEGAVESIAEAPEPEGKTEVEAINSRLDAMESTTNELTEALTSVTGALQDMTTAMDTMKNIVPGASKKVVEDKKPVVKEYKDMSNKEKMEFNRGK